MCAYPHVHNGSYVNQMLISHVPTSDGNNFLDVVFVVNDMSFLFFHPMTVNYQKQVITAFLMFQGAAQFSCITDIKEEICV